MSSSEATSPMRQALIAAITFHAASRPDAAAVLAGELAARSYEARSDDDLFDLAGTVGVDAEKLARIGLLDQTLTPLRPRHICARCEDTGQVRAGDGRFVRCHVCNPAPPKENEIP